ncbi:MAG TPA: YifB family Mg chelatase-like AAA ATPase [Bacillota bacterium]|nr:YifB family Mg chelatase-like AAA ATPase [Bacillota bacterium]
MFCKTYSAGLLGIEGFVVEVETDLSRGIPQCSLVGLPDSAVKESKERVRSALLNSGFEFPLGRLTVNFAPAHLKKVGAAFDLSVAVGILNASNQIQIPFLHETLFIGELSLNGQIKPVHGILPMALAAKQKGLKKIVVPEDNAWEGMLSGLDTYPLGSLKDLLHTFTSPPSQSSVDLLSQFPPEDQFPTIIGQAHARRAIEIAAAGFHNMLLIGPPGTGKTLLASSLPFLLPPLNNDEFMELLSIQSVSGKTLNPYSSANCIRPFRSPHHSITSMGLIGGGSSLKPGEITLAHHGVLFLDEMSEFPRQQLELLRQPIEDRKITLTRNTHHVTFPSRFMLIGSMNPCPCGYYGFSNKTHSCTCSTTTLEKFQKKISGPLLDRFDLKLEVPRLDLSHFYSPGKDEYDVAAARNRILLALQAQQRRFRSNNKRNADMNPLEINQYCTLDPRGAALLKSAYDQLNLSHRAYHRIVKVARTIADLDARETISELDIGEALYLRSMEKYFL